MELILAAKNDEYGEFEKKFNPLEYPMKYGYCDVARVHVCIILMEEEIYLR